MARLEAQKKMGYYPTPTEAVRRIAAWMKRQEEGPIRFIEVPMWKQQDKEKYTLLDPCCGEGSAVYYIGDSRGIKTYGIEPDYERYKSAKWSLDQCIHATIAEARITHESFSILFLNPPYDWENGERMEYIFLKRAHGWLKKGGLLIYIVPENVLLIPKIQKWIARHYKDIKVLKINEEHYPRFKQVVLFGVKREEPVEVGDFPLPPYQYIDHVKPEPYTLVQGKCPELFEAKALSEHEVAEYRDTAYENIKKCLGIQDSKAECNSPLFPLRKGHLLAYLASGALDGKIGDDAVVKCFATRQITSYEDDEKEITHDTYAVCIRVIEPGRWYDVM